MDKALEELEQVHEGLSEKYRIAYGAFGQEANGLSTLEVAIRARTKGNSNLAELAMEISCIMQQMDYVSSAIMELEKAIEAEEGK